MADSCRGAYKEINGTGKEVLVTGPVFLKQIVLTPTEVTDGREITVTLYDGLTSAATDEKIKVSIPRQLNNNTLVNIINRIAGVDDGGGGANPYPTGSLNWIIEAINDNIIAPLNSAQLPGITVPAISGFSVTTPSTGVWSAVSLDNITIFTWGGWAGYSTANPLWDPFNISDLSHISGWDDDTEMSYDRNAAKVFDIPEPGIYFEKGIVGSALRASTSPAAAAKTHVTCIYQQAPSTTRGGTIKAAYTDGATSDPGSNQSFIPQPCKIHSLHIFNDHSAEQGIKLFNGSEEIARFYAGDNSLSQIYLPKPGFIFDDNVNIRQDAYNGRIRVSAIYEEI
tara:strand:- start:775 stop:1791 length:1017 start_codon:yes stop_codon:yes gene_type:complete